MTERPNFLDALGRPDPAEQAAYLDQACAGAPELRRLGRKREKKHLFGRFLKAVND